MRKTILLAVALFVGSAGNASADDFNFLTNFSDAAVILSGGAILFSFISKWLAARKIHNVTLKIGSAVEINISILKNIGDDKEALQRSDSEIVEKIIDRIDTMEHSHDKR